MKVTAERQEKCLVKLTIAVDERTANGYLRRAARALSRRYQMPGFRPGKAPYNVIIRRLGIESVQSQALDQFGDEIYQQGLEESKIEPADQANLDDVTWDPFTLHLTIPVGPEVDLGAYRDIRVAWEEPEVTDEALEQALRDMQKEQSEWTPEERPTEFGDQVVLDIKATVDDQVVLENVGRELVLSPDSPFPVPGFAAEILEMDAGEEREFDLTYPADHYNADIAGKTGHFSVKLNEIRAEALPPLDDEFAMSVGDYDSLDDLKAQLRESLLEDAKNTANNDYEDQIWANLLEVASVEYPDVYVERELDAIKNQFEQQLQQQSMDLESYFRLTNTTEETWREQMQPQAEERLKRNLILAEVIRDQEITVEAEEIDAEIESIVEGLGERADEMREILASPAGRMSIADTVVTRKAGDALNALARGELPATGPAEPQEGEGAEETAAQAEPSAEQDAETEGSAPSKEETDETAQVAEETEATAEPSAEQENELESQAEGPAEEPAADSAQAEASVPDADQAVPSAAKDPAA